MNTSEDGNIEQFGATTDAVTNDKVEGADNANPSSDQATERVEQSTTVTETPGQTVTESQTVSESPAEGQDSSEN